MVLCHAQKKGNDILSGFTDIAYLVKKMPNNEYRIITPSVTGDCFGVAMAPDVAVLRPRTNRTKDCSSQCTADAKSDAKSNMYSHIMMGVLSCIRLS